MKINKKYGILFWITGLSGSGKSSIAKNVLQKIRLKYGPTILIDGDDIRKIFKLKSYGREERFKVAKIYQNLSKFFLKQKINVIFATVALFHKLQNENKKKIKNYVEIFIKSDLKKIKKNKKKKFYIKNKKSVWGVDIKPEFPKKPKITIKNDFKKDVKYLSEDLIKKIYELIKIN